MISDHYCATYRVARGFAPDAIVLFGAHGGMAVSKLLHGYHGDVERIFRIINNAFNDGWWRDKITITKLAQISDQFDKATTAPLSLSTPGAFTQRGELGTAREEEW